MLEILGVSFAKVGFWFVHIPFVNIVKFQFLAQFPVDHLVHLVVVRLVFPLCKFAAFTYYEVWFGLLGFMAYQSL